MLVYVRWLLELSKPTFRLAQVEFYIMKMGIVTVNQFGIDSYLARNMAWNKYLILEQLLLSSLDPARSGLELQSLGTQHIPGEMG